MLKIVIFVYVLIENVFYVNLIKIDLNECSGFYGKYNYIGRSLKP